MPHLALGEAGNLLKKKLQQRSGCCSSHSFHSNVNFLSDCTIAWIMKTSPEDFWRRGGHDNGMHENWPQKIDAREMLLSNNLSWGVPH